MRTLLLAIVLLACSPVRRHACGHVQVKVWSHITGSCYLIVQDCQDPPETSYIVCDTAVWPSVEIGEWRCGKLLSTQ